MVLVIAVGGWLLLLVALCFILKDFSRFIFRKSFGFKRPTEFVDYGEYAVTWTAVFVIACCGFLFYKLSTALMAYALSGDLISFFRMMRGVFTVKSEVQNAFAIKHLISGLLLLPLLQLISCYVIYRGIRSYMNWINSRYGRPTYNETDVLYYGFFATLLFIALEILSYSQNIPKVSGVAHLIYLSVAKLGLVCYFFVVSHLHLLRNEAYRKSLPQYIRLSRVVKRIVYQPFWTIVFTLLVGITLSIPLYLGTQFLESNFLVILFAGLSCYVFYRVIRKVIIRGYDNFGAIMFFDRETPLVPNIDGLSFRKNSKRNMIIGGVVILLLLAKLKLLFFLLVFLFILSAIFLFFHVLIYAFGLGGSVVIATVLGNETPPIKGKTFIEYLKTTTIGFGRATTPALVLGIAAFFILSFSPKAYDYKADQNYVTSVIDQTNYPLFVGFNDGNSCTPISASAIPDFMARCLTLQEDRDFDRQRNWMPKWSNWHGVSMASFYRVASGTGGGSNINMQLIKNEAFIGSFPQDFQRKFTEVLASYQLSLQLTPEEIMTQYFNKVGMIGGNGQSGVAMASLSAFNRPLDELNELEMMYLVASLKRSSKFKTKKDYVDYSVAADYSYEIKKTLIRQAKVWFDQGLIDLKELKILKNQELRFMSQKLAQEVKTTTREFMRLQLPKESKLGATYWSTMSHDNQARMAKAVRQFDNRFIQHKTKSGHELYSAALVVEVETGHILAHYGGQGVTDLTTFAGGSPMGSIIKPFILLELLESGIEPDEVRLYDGKVKGRLTPNNYSRKYSNKNIGINEILGKSLNAPMVNVRQVTEAIPLYQQVEMKFASIGIAEDVFLDMEDPGKKGEHEINYPLGSRNMTLYNIAQAYQTLFNGGLYMELTPFEGKYNPYTLETEAIRTKAKQVYAKENAAVIKTALHHSMLPGGTGTHLSHLLPSDQKFYSKTGTSDGAKHGYTILCDGNILIVSFATYGKITGNHLELNDTPPIPFESGVRSAGVLAAYIYGEWNFDPEPVGQVALK